MTPRDDEVIVSLPDGEERIKSVEKADWHTDILVLTHDDNRRTVYKIYNVDGLEHGEDVLFQFVGDASRGGPPVE